MIQTAFRELSGLLPDKGWENLFRRVFFLKKILVSNLNNVCYFLQFFLNVIFCLLVLLEHIDP